MNNITPLLTEQEQSTLHDALYYMKMAELKKACQLLLLPHAGNKAELILRIMLFVQTGHIIKPAKIPVQSMAKSYSPQPLAPTALMLYGDYKNDAKTRAFFKQLIGPHFHFTAFGIDWLNNRWFQGNPPTYQEFADYWIKEINQRNNTKTKPKKEWAYINFLQQMTKKHPHTSKSDLMGKWKQLQAEKAYLAYKILESVARKLCYTKEKQ